MVNLIPGGANKRGDSSCKDIPPIFHQFIEATKTGYVFKHMTQHRIPLNLEKFNRCKFQRTTSNLQPT